MWCDVTCVICLDVTVCFFGTIITQMIHKKRIVKETESSSGRGIVYAIQLPGRPRPKWEISFGLWEQSCSIKHKTVRLTLNSDYMEVLTMQRTRKQRTRRIAGVITCGTRDVIWWYMRYLPWCDGMLRYDYHTNDTQKRNCKGNKIELSGRGRGIVYAIQLPGRPRPKWEISFGLWEHSCSINVQR